MGLEHKTAKILHAASQQQQVSTEDILVAKAQQRPANGVVANGVTSGYASMDSHSDSDGPDNWP